MKYLGIDYGSKRIGLAVSNDEASLAFPLKTILHDQHLYDVLQEIIQDEKIESIVVGKSLDQWGKKNKIQHRIDIFIERLSLMVGSIPIYEQDERGSSIAAQSHLYGKGNIANEKWTGKNNKKKREHNDAHAATIILQRYLDKKNVF